MSGAVVGIDLGTTHCALAWAGEDGLTEVMDIEQVVQGGQVRGESLLPSFLYLPNAHEFGAGSLALPWAADSALVVGKFARAQGAKSPGRLVSSAKSWLCNEGVDRTAALLPWGSSDEIEKISPLRASTEYISHLVENWAHQQSELGALGDQDVVLTVPASFDAVARELTVRAAKAAGIERPVLLEEPQAALYAWLDSQGDNWRNELGEGDVVLVVDVGGGTTDFSLMAIDSEDGTLSLRRIAVGDHILLGGDNMDLALAYAVRQQLQKEREVKLDNWQLQALTQGCRVAKEALFADPTLSSQPLAIPSRGAKLIGGTIRAELTREMMNGLLVEGFFPRCAIDDRPRQARRAGLAEMGLPYASDAAISRHLAHFLTRHRDEADGGDFVRPTAVLFNGGVLKANPVRERLLGCLNGWVTAAGANEVTVLDSPSLDVSVARGAAYFAKVRRGEGIRIRGGIAHSYYVGVEQAMPAVPGFEPPMLAVCLAPFGLEEGSTIDLEGHEFGLYVGEPADFRFFASSVRKNDQPGTQIEDWPEDELEPLPPIETVLGGADGPSEGERLAVGLRCEVTEIGTIVLSCVERGGAERSWALEFNVRLKKDAWEG